MVNLSNKMVNLDLEVCLFLNFVSFLKTFKGIFSKICGIDTSHSSIRQKEYSCRGWVAIL